MRGYKKALSVFLWILGAVLLWEGAAWLLQNGLQDPMAEKKLPYLHQVLASFGEYGPELSVQAGITLSRAALGFLWGAGIGILLALLMDLSGILEKMIMPYVLASQMIPILGLAPVVFGLVKDLDTSRIVIAAYMTFFPVTISLARGLKSIGAEEKLLMKACAAGRKNYYLKLAVPFSLPYFFSGLKIAAPMAVTASVLVDTLSAKDGIGYILILTLYGGGTVGKFWPAVLISSALGVLCFMFINVLQYICIPWQRKKKEVIARE
ncbi:ABC transporter permease subunit [bacterium 210820-DFI.6.37]|nr:ABC transporter permease subunit [bacterium 210820-DFI.6.37]